MQQATPGLRLAVATGEVAAFAAPLALVAAIAGWPPMAGAPLPPWASALAAALVAVAAAGATIALLADGLRRRHPASLAASGAAALLGAGFAAVTLGARAIPAVLLVVAGAWLVVALVPGTNLLARFRADVRTAVAIFLLVEVVTAAVLIVPALEAPFAASALMTAAGLLAVAGLLRTPGTARIGALLMAGGAAALALAAAGSAETLAGHVALAAGVAVASIPLPDAALPRAAVEVDGPTAPSLPAVSRSVSDGLLLFDGHLRLRDWNPAAATLLGLDADASGMRFEDATGMPLGRIRAADGPVVERAPRTDEPVELLVLPHPDGIMVLARAPGGSAAAGDQVDRLGRELRGTIEELVQARRTIELQRAEIERATSVDPLTGVGNRSAVMQRLETEVAQARRYAHPVAIVLIDVDGMAAINHEHGLEVGDAVLREVALRHRLRVRGADALGRIAGDAFLAILPHTDEGGAATFADALRRRLAQRPIGTEAGALAVTVSVGVAVMRPGEELDSDGLLTRAEEALASARAAGGDRIALDRLHGLARLEERRPPGAPDASVEEETTQDSGA
jgi:diguanylate cyclase (GGDEF)-like protein